MSDRRRVLVTVILWSLVGSAVPIHAAADSPPWNDALVDGGGEVWKARWIVEAANESDQAIEGGLWTVPIGRQEDQIDLVGQRAESVRVCDIQGRELLFDLTDSRGCSKRIGPLTEGDHLSFCIECPAARKTATTAAPSRARYVIYCDNPRATVPTDFLRSTLVNGGFEAGQESPEDWKTASTDSRHRLAWATDHARTGGRSVRAEVDPGAEPAWVQWRQDPILVFPGARYRLTGWVRARDVKGSAGWYVHVHADRHMAVNQVANAGEGTYDWREVTLEFDAPAKARTATVGTVLHGTGTAWFDDVRLIRLDKPVEVRVVSSTLERLKLADVPGSSEWSAPRDRWPARVSVSVINPDDQPAEHVVVFADLHRAIHSIARPGRSIGTVVFDPTGGQARSTTEPLSSVLLGRRIVFVGSLPPRSRKSFHVYLAPSSEGPEDQRTTYAVLVRSVANLVRNPDFETGGELPEGWRCSAGSPEKGEPSCKFARRRGGLFGEHCAELEVPTGARPQWSGWLQGPIPVRPGASYFYAGWLKTRQVNDGSVTLHGHWHAADGALVKSSPFFSTPGHSSGDADWTFLQAFVQAPGDATGVMLHLTMDAHGIVWHDGIVFCRVLQGVVGAVETAKPDPLVEGPVYRVWQVNPLIKVFRDDPPGQPIKELRAFAAANEYEPIQLVLRSREPLRNVRVEVSLLRGRGRSLPPVQIDRVGYVPVDKPSAYYQSQLPSWYRLVPVGAPRTDGWAGDWPDPLPPCRPFDLPSDQSQPIWLTIHIPAGTPSGTYAGDVTLRADGVPAARIPLRVDVWPFELPATPSLRVIFDLRSGPGGNPFGDGSIGELRKWYTLLAQHRVSPGLLPQPVFRYEGGRVEMDTTSFDAAAGICLDELKMSVFYSPDIFYAFGWAYKPRPFLGYPAFTEKYREAYTACYRSYLEHLKKRGWYDRVVHYLCDEPHAAHEHVRDQMKTLCEMIHSVDRKVPIYVSTWHHVPAWNGFITQWGVGQYGCFPVDEMRRRLESGDRIWFTTDGQQALDTPYLATERLLPYYSFKYGATGYEFWGVSWWTYDPWDRAWHKFISQSDEGKVSYWVRYPNGDGYLTYPGRRVGLDRPVSSIRLEQVREGIEDYEYLCILQNRMAGARGKAPPEAIRDAEKTLEEVRGMVTIPNPGGLRSTEILPDPEVVPALRYRVAQQIVTLQETDRR